MSSLGRAKRWLLWWTIGYAAVVVGVGGSMLWQRRTALSELSTPQAKADWEAWREDVRKQQSEPGPVQRRVPKSVEPPALVLFRDYFVVSILGALFFSSMLYWIVAWFVTGAFSNPPADR